MSSFWGISISHSRKEHLFEKDVHITGAALASRHTTDTEYDPVEIIINRNVVCNLCAKNGVLSAPLDLWIQKGQTLSFSTHAKRTSQTAYLTGYTAYQSKSSKSEGSIQ